MYNDLNSKKIQLNKIDDHKLGTYDFFLIIKYFIFITCAITYHWNY